MKKRLANILAGALSILASGLVFANQIPIKAFQHCCSGKACIDYPIKNGEVFVVTASNQVFLRTDKEGIFHVDDILANKIAMVYLANYREIIYAGCYSDITRSNTNKVVIGGLCPSDNCKIIQA